jgi:hypothetical protein
MSTNWRATSRAKKSSGRHERDPQQIGRARRAQRNAGGDDDAFAGAGKTLVIGNARGAFDHVVEVVGVVGEHAVQAPDERKPARGFERRRQRDDRHFGALAGGA